MAIAIGCGGWPTCGRADAWISYALQAATWEANETSGMKMVFCGAESARRTSRHEQSGTTRRAHLELADR